MKGKILVSIMALGASSVALANGSYIAAAPAAAATPNYFDGFVVGIDGSMQHLNGHAQDNTGYRVDEFSEPDNGLHAAQQYYRGSAFSNQSSLDTDIGDNTLGGGLFVGYGKVFNSNFYLGGEVYARYAHNTSDEDTSKDINFYHEGDLEGIGRLDTSMDISSDWSYGAALKFGYLLTPKTMLYLLAGIEYSKFDVDVNHTLSSTNSTPVAVNWNSGYSFSQQKVAFVPGVGIETMITDKLSLKAEYTYADYGQFSHGNNSTSPTVEYDGYSFVGYNSSEDKVDLKRGLYTLGLSYHFNGI